MQLSFNVNIIVIKIDSFFCSECLVEEFVPELEEDEEKKEEETEKKPKKKNKKKSKTLNIFFVCFFMGIIFE